MGDSTLPSGESMEDNLKGKNELVLEDEKTREIGTTQEGLSLLRWGRGQVHYILGQVTRAK